jgi:hypothetical protein
MNFDKRTSLDIETEGSIIALDNLPCLIFGATLIFVAVGLIIGAAIWL